MLLVLYLGSGLLCPRIQGYFPLSLIWSSVWQDLCWGLWSIWTWVLCIVLDMDLFAFFYMLISSYASTICWRCFLSLLYNFSFFVKNQIFIGVWINIFYLIPLIHLSVFMPIPDCFHYYSSIVELEIRDGDAFGSSFHVQDCFSYPGFFVFLYKGEHCSFNVYEEFCWDFDGGCLESVDCFW